MLCNLPAPSVPHAEPGTFSCLPPSLGLFRVTLFWRDQAVLAAFLQRWKKIVFIYEGSHLPSAYVEIRVHSLSMWVRGRELTYQACTASVFNRLASCCFYIT